jgi:hypothetical protein
MDPGWFKLADRCRRVFCQVAYVSAGTAALSFFVNPTVGSLVSSLGSADEQVGHVFALRDATWIDFPMVLLNRQNCPVLV